MRRIILLILCAVLLIGTVFADNLTDDVQNTTVVSTDGSARVTMTVAITLEEPVEGLTFPVPRGAADVTLNGELVETTPSRINTSVDLVSLSHLDGVVGSKELTFCYTLTNLFEILEDETNTQETEEDLVEEATEAPQVRLLMRLPLLSGFEYPVDDLAFSVTFPAGVEPAPTFYSGYFLQSIESDLIYQVKENVVEGSVTTKLKDKETLRMEMVVTQDQFPDLVIVEEQAHLHLLVMLGIAGFALLFWLFFLRSLPVFGTRRKLPPVGIHAGELCSYLTMEGGDLTMLVFHWAQLGYIRISPDKRGRVWLHKRMDMGNERSDFEMKTFHRLFGKNTSVYATGSRYGRLWDSVRQNMEDAALITKGGRNARGFFRFLAMLVSTAAGIAMGMNLELEAPWYNVAIAGLALLGCFTGWKIQTGTMTLHLRSRRALPLCAACCIVWICVGILAERAPAALISVAFQLLAGALTAWSGRRTKAGWRMACKIMGLRHYLKGIKRDEVKEELERDPDFFFQMAPFAMALGVDYAFAGRFGSRVMPPCSYMDADRSLRRNAHGWAYLMRITAEKMDDAGRNAKKYRKR